MSLTRKLFAVVLGLVGFFSLFAPAQAQNLGFVSATVTPTTTTFNNPITFNIVITNATPSQQNTVYVSNVFSGFAISNSASMVNSVSNNLFGQITSDNTQFVFRFSNLIAGDIARLTFTVTPLSSGPFTNQITIATPLINLITNTSVTATITAPSTDLAVGMTNVASGVMVNDPTVIGLSVTNLGPNSASGVVLSNLMPASFKLLSIAPANTHTFTNGNLALDLGTLTNGATRRFQVTVQPTNAVSNFNLIASVSAGSIQDANPTNNVVTNVITVSDFLLSDLIATPQLPQRFNPQTGLIEMDVLLQNNAATNVAAARVMVSGLTNSTWLYNAVGTNNGAAYVLYNTNLAGGASVQLLLEFYALVRTPFTNFSLSAEAVPAINLSAGTNGVNATITNSAGNIMIEFATTPGKTYTIVYTSPNDPLFTNALTAQPSIVAPANRVQWIDSGPPKTVSLPASRIYRVFQSQ